MGLTEYSYQEYERVYDHQRDPEAVEVLVEALVDMSQFLKICFHATFVAGYWRQAGKRSIDENPRLRTVGVQHTDD